MSMTLAELVLDLWKKLLASILIVLQVGIALPQQAQAATGVRQPAKTSALSLFAKDALASAHVTLASMEARTDLATRSALSKLHPPDEFAQLTSHFEEPLIATGPTSSSENNALLATLEHFRDRTQEDDFSSLSNFLQERPSSAWRVALMTNLGLLEYHYGYFQHAIDSYSQAWKEGRSITDPKGKALVDRAVGELARMHARLGHVHELEALLKDIGNRPISGPATEAITGAREGLATMRTDPGVSFLCGPFALKNLLLSQGFQPEKIQFLDEVRSSPEGVSFEEVSNLADRAQLPHRVVFRTASQPVPVPSIIHWRVSHFAAIVGYDGKRYHIIDPTFGTDLWVTKAAINAESDGYFLTLQSDRTYAWRDATAAEKAAARGMGNPQQTEPGATCTCEVMSQPAPATSPMTQYSFTEMEVSLHLTDTPVGYAPPIGPSAFTTLTYNQREAGQPANFSFFNVSQKWTINWLSYIQDDPRSAGGSVSRYIAGGGYFGYIGYNGSTGAFASDPHDASILSRTKTGAIVYKRTLADGSVETYSASNGATTYPRLVFMTQLTDPSGNSITLSYDNQQRLTSVTDATGRITTFTYGLATFPLQITKITDPFGRSAQLAYDANGRLLQITDILGIQSTFTYDTSSLINALTTPYGKTTFIYGGSGTYRYLTATDPLSHTERLEWNQPVSQSIIPFSEPKVPKGIINPFNSYINYRDTFYWDKHAYAVAAGDYTKARVRHWMHNRLNANEMYHAMESYKSPLENRVWLNYPGQTSYATYSGTLDSPSRIARILDDGTTQLTQMSYNSLGHVTDMIDPVGRETQFAYAANGIDLVTVQQRTSASGFSTIAQFTYNNAHLPLSYTDAAGQTTNFVYNAAGQLTQMTNALGETTQYKYDNLGYLSTIINANDKTQASFTYDGYSRVATATDSEGYEVKYAYDAADRVTQETFPDNTTRKFTWTSLDLTAVTDRQSNTTHYAYDAIRDLLSTTDPLSHVTRLAYWQNQSLKSLTDPNGNTTTWNIDVQNRVTGKQYADGTQVLNGYENTTSRLKTITDAMAQVKTFTYGQDDTLTAIAYTNSVNATPNVGFTYDLYFRRIASMTDGNGVRAYTYQSIGSLGALQLLKESGPYTNDSISYQYDALSRLASRSVDISTETFAYDALSRLTTHGTALGTFNLNYLGQTGQLTSQKIATGTVGTTWTYDSNTNDRRLLSVNNGGATRSFNYTTTPENLITQINESAPATAASAPKTWSYDYDAAYRLTQASSNSGSDYSYGLDSADNITSFRRPSGSASVSYNELNQINNYGHLSYIYDKNGNVLDDGLRTYTWDAENRLLSVTSKSNAAQKTMFRYDGLGRRTAIDATNGMTSETRYLWCGEQLCQARTSTDTVSRRYYSEGEYLLASGTSLFYSRDQLGSVRDVLATQNGARVASFDYDPYGTPDGSSGRISSDFRYAGLFFDQNDGIYLSRSRGYSPQSGNWLSRDPLGEEAGSNSYSYAGSNPIADIDPLGLTPCNCVAKATAVGAEIGGGLGLIGGALAGGAGGTLALPGGGTLAGGYEGGAAGLGAGIVGGGALGGALGSLLCSSSDSGSSDSASVVHGNSLLSPRQTELYYLINESTDEIDKIGITSAPDGRYSQAYLSSENVYYQTQAVYSSRLPAYIEENLRLIAYFAANGTLPRLNRNFH